MDIVPTALHAADGTAPTDDTGEFDGTSILDLLSNGTDLPERDLYWELDGQTAIRRGNHKLVIDGVLVEEDEPQTHIHLSDLSTDIHRHLRIHIQPSLRTNQGIVTRRLSDLRQRCPPSMN